MSQIQGRVDSANSLYDLIAQNPHLEVDTNGLEVARLTIAIKLCSQGPSDTVLRLLHKTSFSPLLHTQTSIPLEPYQFMDAIHMEAWRRKNA